DLPGAGGTTDGGQQPTARGGGSGRVEEGAAGRLRRSAPQATTGQGPHTQGERPSEPQGLQGRAALGEAQHRASVVVPREEGGCHRGRRGTQLRPRGHAYAGADLGRASWR